MDWSERLKREFLSGWKPFEVIWLVVFIIAQIWAYVQQDDNTLLEMISGISGILCVVLVSKGKISNYFFGLIFAYTYFYVAWGQNFLGEMNTVLYVYLPAQFIGYFMWKNNMQNDNGGESVVAKALTPKGWIALALFIGIGTFLFVQVLQTAGGSSTDLDGLTTIIVVAAQLLMILRYREQWLLWIVLNILSIILWAETQAMYLMYSAYLLNSLYGYYNWTKLKK
ncbi:nicotinamide riboside transporter PnuC [Rodentibacter pneumotropicus]|uniref:Nicotinamide riboside transporter PnuC n=1 Tax=Rodentibacter pneumotropicus TaxID=758 RepID=A0A448MT85_9PAST|nr:nicotinamide riboside transporter PnuC [Rodentibacter pneumotropicus]NBH75188.1 nicotinamide riboside transporter PnuC [Rodentibacter pneumotropicus]OOF60621.1 nicotinamide riboside transporter pnuC [Rodentibacter pneumotropicus]THA02842.1 nicotinamide riboside transporter PnuC [Rodentibacter pneumotropicus]THA08053.1 nicotinamide riboside transporter PnuC [Rodentibacter pneumotropicus]THA13211.1 nicotinamide riboside transporter PnuC [Rodentibacter pneumotropicus]